MTTTINASTSNGIVNTADGSGIIKVQSNGVTTNALAWVNFNNTTGTRNASYNVSSVTVVSTGRWTVNMTNALADANYCPLVSTQNNATSNYSSLITGLNQTTTSFDTYHFEAGVVSYLATNVAVFIAVFGN